MKTSLVLLTVFIFVLLSISLVLANPTMLPKHPGYPMGKAVDPVSGQSLANDPGQTNATGENSLAQASAFDDVHVKQSLSINQNDQRLLEKPGAGVLPKVQGPNIKIEPPCEGRNESECFAAVSKSDEAMTRLAGPWFVSCPGFGHEIDVLGSKSATCF